MKHLLSLFVLWFLTVKAYPECPQVRPLWDEDRHFIYYKCLLISGSLYRLQDLCKDLEPELKKDIQHEIDTIKLNMGIVPYFQSLK